MGDVNKRRRLIRRLVSDQSISTQTELVQLLMEQGITCTQASISRDIAALGLMKVKGRYALPERPPVQADLVRKIKGRVLTMVKAGESLLILRTEPGEANGVALALDQARWPSVVGTIAGDDTVFIAVDGKRNQQKAMERLKAFLPDGME